MRSVSRCFGSLVFATTTMLSMFVLLLLLSSSAVEAANKFRGIKITPKENIAELSIAWYPKGDVNKRTCATTLKNLKANREIVYRCKGISDLDHSKSFLHIWTSSTKVKSAKISKVYLSSKNKGRTTNRFWPGTAQNKKGADEPGPHRSLNYDCFNDDELYDHKKNDKFFAFDYVNAAVNTGISYSLSAKNREHGGGIYIFSDHSKQWSDNRLTLCEGGVLKEDDMGIPYSDRQRKNRVNSAYVGRIVAGKTAEIPGKNYNSQGLGQKYILTRPEADTLSIATWNFGAIPTSPSPLCDNDSKKVRRYLKEMVYILSGMFQKNGKDIISDNRPDVIAIQEVWNDCLGNFKTSASKNLRNAVKNALNRAGYSVVDQGPNGSLTNCPYGKLCMLNSGLMMATRHSWVAGGFEGYKYASQGGGKSKWAQIKKFFSGSNESVANKGILYRKIKKVHKGVTRYYHVFNTHLHSSRIQSRYRTKQLNQLKQYIAKKVPSSDKNPVIVLGDMNIDESNNGDEYANMLSTLDASDPNYAIFSNPYGTDCFKNYAVNNDPIHCNVEMNGDVTLEDTGLSKSKSLDHILYLNYKKKPTSAIRAALVVRAPNNPIEWNHPGRDLANHYPTWALFCFKKNMQQCKRVLPAAYVKSPNRRKLRDSSKAEEEELQHEGETLVEGHLVKQADKRVDANREVHEPVGSIRGAEINKRDI